MQGPFLMTARKGWKSSGEALRQYFEKFCDYASVILTRFVGRIVAFAMLSSLYMRFPNGSGAAVLGTVMES
jgi:hypothetical protein